MEKGIIRSPLIKLLGRDGCLKHASTRRGELEGDF